MDLLEVGKIVNTHGLRGEVKVVPWTDYPEVFEDIDFVSIVDSSCIELVIHAEPVDTADVTHFYFFAIFFIGSGSVLAILIKKQVASGEIMGSQTRRKDM